MSKSNGANGASGERMLRMMIVDDSKFIRRRIERSQQNARLQVVGSASNGREAVELFQKTNPTSSPWT